MNKKILLPAFILMVLAQLYLPASMILERENILDSGKEFRFKAAPVDPNDPFRGKYITLSFDANSATVPDAVNWSYGDKIFVELTTDSLGFASIQSVTREAPAHTDDYVHAEFSYIISDSNSIIQIQYPFDRFYMEESKAPAAELAYNESVRDTNSITYALVRVSKGEAVISDVLIDDVSIREHVLQNRKINE